MLLNTKRIYVVYKTYSLSFSVTNTCINNWQWIDFTARISA